MVGARAHARTARQLLPVWNARYGTKNLHNADGRVRSAVGAWVGPRRHVRFAPDDVIAEQMPVVPGAHSPRRSNSAAGQEQGRGGSGRKEKERRSTKEGKEKRRASGKREKRWQRLAAADSGELCLRTRAAKLRSASD